MVTFSSGYSSMDRIGGVGAAGCNASIECSSTCAVSDLGSGEWSCCLAGEDDLLPTDEDGFGVGYASVVLDLDFVNGVLITSFFGALDGPENELKGSYSSWCSRCSRIGDDGGKALIVCGVFST